MDNSPLNKLAAELRNKIYKFTLMRDDGLKITTASLIPRLAHKPNTSRLAALTATCDQIRQESMPVLLNNDIELLTEADIAYEHYEKAAHLKVEIEICINKIKVFLHALGPHAPKLANLTLNLGAWRAAADRDWNPRQAKCIAYMATFFQSVCKSYSVQAAMKIQLGKPLPPPFPLPFGVLPPFILPDPVRFRLFLKLDGGDADEVSKVLIQCVKKIAVEQKTEQQAVGKGSSVSTALTFAAELGFCVIEELDCDDGWSFERCKLRRGRV